MFWLVVIGIVIIFWIIKPDSENNSSKKEPPQPPREDVLMLGCCGAVDCGYWSPVFECKSGEYIMVPNKCHCGYCKEDIAEGSKCSFAKEHPKELRVSYWLSE